MRGHLEVLGVQRHSMGGGGREVRTYQPLRIAACRQNHRPQVSTPSCPEPVTTCITWQRRGLADVV